MDVRAGNGFRPAALCTDVCSGRGFDTGLLCSLCQSEYSLLVRIFRLGRPFHLHRQCTVDALLDGTVALDRMAFAGGIRAGTR